MMASRIHARAQDTSRIIGPSAVHIGRFSIRRQLAEYTVSVAIDNLRCFGERRRLSTIGLPLALYTSRSSSNPRKIWPGDEGSFGRLLLLPIPNLFQGSSGIEAKTVKPRVR